MGLSVRYILVTMLGISVPSIQAAPPVPVVDSAGASDTQSYSSRLRQSQATSDHMQGLSASPASLLYQFELLQQEVQTLRGMLEQQAHQINQMRDEQRDRYLDLDRRISLQGKPGKLEPEPNYTPSTSTTNFDSDQPRSGLDEKKSYHAAFDLIRNKHYDDAVSAFAQFVRDFPDGEYTGNAYYWLGEVQVVKANYQAAQSAFETLLSRFPQHRKTADAKYKLGKVYRELGDRTKAKQLLQEVINQYPGSSAAKLSESELRNLSP